MLQFAIDPERNNVASDDRIKRAAFGLFRDGRYQSLIWDHAREYAGEHQHIYNDYSRERDVSQMCIDHDHHPSDKTAQNEYGELSKSICSFTHQWPYKNSK